MHEAVTKQKMGMQGLGEGRWDHTAGAQIFTEGLCKVQFVTSTNVLAKSPDTGTAVLVKQ